MKKFILIIYLLLIAFQSKANDSELDVYVLYNHDIFNKQSRSYKVAWALFENAATKNNITLKIIHSSWNKSLKLLGQNKIDSTLLAFHTKARNKKMSFSVPVALDQISIFKNKNDSKPKDYKSSSVGVHKGSVHTILAKKVGFDSIYESTTRNELHRMLMAGRIDYILENESLIEHFCIRVIDNKNCLLKEGTPLKQEALYIVYNNKDSVVQKLFNVINKEIYNQRESAETQELFLNAGYTLEQFNLWKRLINEHADKSNLGN